MPPVFLHYACSAPSLEQIRNPSRREVHGTIVLRQPFVEGLA